MPKDKRLEKKLEIQRAHFSFGNDNSKYIYFMLLEMPAKSYGQELIQDSAVATVHDAAKLTEAVKDRRNAVENSRKTNWIVGKNPVSLALNGTSSGDAYQAKMQGSFSAQSL